MESLSTKLRRSYIVQGKEANMYDINSGLFFLRRRDIAEKYRKQTPEPIVKEIYQRNSRVYGDPTGPSLEFLINRV